MKKLISLIFVMVLAFTLTSCQDKHKELFKITDRVVESLYTTYEHYDMFGKHIEYTSDGEYHIMPTGRLINVRIERAATDKEYEDLLKALQKHYKDNPRVKKVYRCQAGTLMIDCRN